MDTAFSHALRVVVCPSCGGAVHGLAAGGESRCSVCDATLALPPRDEAPIGVGLTQLTEADRLARLEGQDPSPPPLAPAIEPLVEDGVLIPARAAEAFNEWQLSRAALDGGAAAAEARFFGITLLLARHMAQQGDDLMLRALLETAIDLLPSPSSKQVVRSMAAREAARLGDLPAAEEWFAPCDAASTDLCADSAYRCTAAYLATHKRQFERVLAVLGAKTGLVPICDDLKPLCAVLRANALERLDQVSAAVAALEATMREVPEGPAAIGEIVRAHSDLAACRRSYVPARARVDGGSVFPGPKDAQLGQDQGGAGRPVGTGRKALPWLVISVAFLVLYGVTDAGATTSGGQRIDVFFLVLSLSFASVGFLFWRKSRRGSGPPQGK
ncbi:MAG: hypothetical protein JRI68_10775 [Deltaproteobacteria bacterium]|nr:hypothetical protein [Deltaproteobacteria bacterium]